MADAPPPPDRAPDATPDTAREPVLVSACLLGLPCRYDGELARDEVRAAAAGVLATAGDVELVAFCPEESGGLGTPRPPAWIEEGDAAAVLAGEARMVTDAGVDVTAAFRRGAEAARDLCRARGIRRAVLKERSPSCGVAATHVDGVPVPGPGVTARLLLDDGLDLTGV